MPKRPSSGAKAPAEPVGAAANAVAAREAAAAGARAAGKAVSGATAKAKMPLIAGGAALAGLAGGLAVMRRS